MPNDLMPVEHDATRLPPQAIEAECSVLGALMLDNQAWDRVADVMSERDLYRSDHRKIFHAIAQLIDCQMPADSLTVADALGDELSNVGGHAYLGSLVVNTPSAANIRRYAEIVRERSVKRGLITLCNQALDRLYGPMSDSPQELVSRLEDGLAALSQAHGTPRGRSFGEVVSTVFNSLEERKGRGDITGLATGFTDLDKMTAGFQPGDLIVVGGRPSMGKTALAMNICEHVAVVNRLPVAVFSLEMSPEQLVQRMVGSLSLVNQHQLRTGRLDKDDWGKLSQTHAKLHDAPLVIEETFDLRPDSLRAKAKRIAKENPGLALIVVDYIQLLEGSAEKRVDAVAEITRGMKRIAKELQIPVVALSQLNRGVEARTNKRPMMSDLRESGSVEQDADLILFMYRDDVYDAESPNPGVAEVIIAKQRNGPVGHIYLTFRAQYARFENHTGEINQKQWKPRSKPFEGRARADVDG